MKTLVLGLGLIFYSNSIALAQSNSNLFRRSSCVMDVRDFKTNLEVFHDGKTMWSEPEDGKGMVVIKNSPQNSVPALVQDVDMRLVDSCTFQMEYMLNWGTHFHHVVRVNKCQASADGYKGLVSITWRNFRGDPLILDGEVTCK